MRIYLTLKSQTELHLIVVALLCEMLAEYPCSVCSYNLVRWEDTASEKASWAKAVEKRYNKMTTEENAKPLIAHVLPESSEISISAEEEMLFGKGISTVDELQLELADGRNMANDDKPKIEGTTKGAFSVSKNETTDVEREKKGGEDYASILARRHYHRVLQEAACKIPRAKVIRVNDVYPDPIKTYYPLCTVLHRCSEDTGCCADINKRCSPDKVANVTFYFIVSQLDHVRKLPGKTERSTTYEALTFLNHTECRCRAFGSSMPRDTPQITTEEEDTPPVSVEQLSAPTHQFKCSCPSAYSVRHMKGDSCSCDCFDRQRECIRYKKGLTYFNHIDRYCISTKQCVPPTCYYGSYLGKIGRCPTKHEKVLSEKMDK